MSSYTSDNGRPTPISLEDHTDEASEQCRVLWAKSVTIDDYVVVSGTAPGLGAYVVWNCTVETLDVSSARAARQVTHTDMQLMSSPQPIDCKGPPSCGRGAWRLQHAPYLQIDGLADSCRAAL